MSGNPNKVFALFAVLLAAWAVVFWMWPTSGREPRVSFDDAPPLVATGPKPAVDHGLPFPDATSTSPRDVARPAPRAGDEARRGPVSAVEPPRFRDYTVQAGDVSFEAIAQRTLGDRRLASAIARSNPLVNPAKLIPGRTKLKIPEDPSNIQGRVVTVPSPAQSTFPQSPAAAGNPGTSGEPAAKPPEPAGDVRTHVVQQGETLSEIAKSFYGRSALWTLIYDANRDRLPSPERVRPGVTLRIPPAPADGR